MEGIQALDLSSLLEQFEEASQSLDETDLTKESTTLQKCKSLPASRVCSAANSPAHTPPATPPPCMLDKIRARHGDTAKRKSTIMLPMGAPAKRSRGKAATLEVSSSSPGSSKLQRILSRKTLECPLTQSPMLLAELQKTPGPSPVVHNTLGPSTVVHNTLGPSTVVHNTLGPRTVVHNTLGPSTPGGVVKQEPVLHPPNGLSNPAVTAKSLTVSGLAKSLLMSSPGMNGVQQVMQSSASCVSVPVTLFSTQPVVVGNNIAHPVPLILTTVGPSSGQQNIPMQFVMASSTPPAGSIVIDARSSSLQVSRPAQKLVGSFQAPAKNGSPAFNPVVTTPTSTVNGTSDCLQKGVKAGVGKPPPIQIKKVPRTHYTTVNTRAEGIPLDVLDSVMDHDYCANSPRRVIVDEFELDLSPTRPVHKVVSLPIIKAGETQASREIDMVGKPNSNTRGSASTQSLPDTVSKINCAGDCVHEDVTSAVSVPASAQATQEIVSKVSLPATTGVSVVQSSQQAMLDILLPATTVESVVQPSQQAMLDILLPATTAISVVQPSQQAMLDTQQPMPEKQQAMLDTQQAMPDTQQAMPDTQQAMPDILSGAWTSSRAAPSAGSVSAAHQTSLCIQEETASPLVRLQPSNVVQGSKVFQPASAVKNTSTVQTGRLSSDSFSNLEVINPVAACSNDVQTKVLSPQTTSTVVKGSLLQIDSLTDKRPKGVHPLTNSKAESVVSEMQEKRVSIENTMLIDSDQDSHEYNICSDIIHSADSQPPPLPSMPVFTEEEAIRVTVSPKTPIKFVANGQDKKSSAVSPLTSSEHEAAGDAVSRVSSAGDRDTSDQVPTEPSASSSDEMLDYAIVPHSPVHADDDPAVSSCSAAPFSGPFDLVDYMSQPLEEHEMYTEEDLAAADRDRFIRFAEEERQEKEAALQSREKRSDRRNKKSWRSRRWRPGNSPIKEDNNSFFNKIPSYYTALDTPRKTGRKQLTGEGVEDMSITDFISHDHSSPDSAPTYSKLPAYHSCFTNSTKYDDAAVEDNSCRGSQNDSSKPKYSFTGALDNVSRSGSRSRSRSRERSTSRGRSRKRVRSASSSDSSRSWSRSQHQGGKRSRRSRSSVSGSSRSSSSSSSSWSSSHSRSRSRSSKSGGSSEDLSFKRRQKRKDKIRKMEERKIVYVGRIPEKYTRKDLRKRFERFGQIEDVSVHFREAGDNYGFVTFFYTCDAYTAIDKGNDSPNDLKFDLCFGGRRHFCANGYADLDGNKETEEEYTPLPAKDPGGFDELLKQFQQKRNKK